MFKRLLIANRGEIACRIIKSAQQLGMTTIVIYSDVDANALYVQQADEAYAIGAAAASASYLSIEKIIHIAKQAKAEAIHPGYGFLAENAHFAHACEQADIIFVGPRSEHIHVMGIKDQAKKIAEDFACPVLPGYAGNNQDEAHLLKQAEKIGFPVLIKPVAGGGGKGMRVVHKAQDWSAQISGAKREALAAFDNDKVLIEKYIAKPRHIEVQVLADTQGHAVYLFERDCSLQRRYQKVIEQAPAPNFSQTLREKMGMASLNIVQGLGYVGAGTVEFLLDSENNFYFMEMNTRLQVEHGVTEMITGVDIVAAQLRIAQGKTLSLMQNALTWQGVSIQARIYAEDPSEDFLPATGRVRYLQWPEGEGIRIDAGVQAGDQVTIYYDPLLAKLLVHAPTHAQAWQALALALQKTRIAGVKNNLTLLRRIAKQYSLMEAGVDTHYIDDHTGVLCKPESVEDLDCVFMAMANVLKQSPQQALVSPWQVKRAWRLNSPGQQRIDFYQGNQRYSVLVKFDARGYLVTVGDETYAVHTAVVDGHDLRLQIAEQEYQRSLVWTAQTVTLLSDNKDLIFHLPSPDAQSSTQAQDNAIKAPMPGKVVQVLVTPQQVVQIDQALIVLEAMKMEHTVRAPCDGTVEAIFFETGDQLEEGAELVDMKPA